MASLSPKHSARSLVDKGMEVPEGGNNWPTLAGRVRWELMTVGIPVLPDLPSDWPPAGGSGASVTEIDRGVNISWNIPSGLGDPSNPSTSDSMDDARRQDVHRIMLTAIAEILAFNYVLAVDAEGWTGIVVFAGPSRPR